MSYTARYSTALEAVHTGDWDRAHKIVQEIDTPEAAWIHAYLHRVEGDLWNASFWYRRAGKAECTTSLDMEWKVIYDAIGSDRAG